MFYIVLHIKTQHLLKLNKLNYIPEKIYFGWSACPYFEQLEQTYIDEHTFEEEKEKYKNLIAWWKENNANVDKRVEVKYFSLDWFMNHLFLF